MLNIAQFLKSFISKNKVIIFALVASLLFHFLLFSKFYLTFPKQTNHQQTLNVRLANLQSKQNSSPEPILDKLSSLNSLKPLQSPPTTAVAIDLNDIVEKSLNPLEKPLLPTKPTSTKVQQEVQSTEQVMADTTDHATISNVTLNNTEQDSIDVTKMIATQPYKYVEIEFEITQNDEMNSSGTGRTTFNLDKNQTYTLISTIQTKGPNSTKLNIIKQTSEGIVTENGLIPSYYSSQYSNEPSKAQSARFFWPERVLLLHSSEIEKTVTLLTDTQDILSFMYQFMFSPPKNNGELTVTNGELSQSITYTSLGEEQVATGIGELKTIHLQIINVEQEKTEIWLSIDYQYLPVKIRKTLNSGTIIEETAVNIFTSKS